MATIDPQPLCEVHPGEQVFVVLTEPHDFLGVQVGALQPDEEGHEVPVTVLYTGGIPGYALGDNLRLWGELPAYPVLTVGLLTALETAATPDRDEPAGESADTGWTVWGDGSAAAAAGLTRQAAKEMVDGRHADGDMKFYAEHDETGETYAG